MKDIGFALVPSPEWKLPILLYHIAPGQESVSGKVFFINLTFMLTYLYFWYLLG